MEAFLTSTVLVALAEIGDKTQLLSFVLAARLRKPGAIIAGIFVATLFNHALAGYGTAAEMFHAFAASTRAQVVACFDLLAGPDRQSRPLRALQAGDLESFAALTAGPSAAAPVALALHQKESLVSSYLHGLL